MRTYSSVCRPIARVCSQRCAALALAGAVALVVHTAFAQPTITLDVDATDLPRRLARAHMTIRLEPGRRDLRFIKWTPGNHAPSGPIQNLIDLVITDCTGRPLSWARDPADVTHLSVQAPAACEWVNVDLAYIADQPSDLSGSTDTYGRSTFGGLNWNTVLLYPGGMTHQQITVAASLTIPADWSIATSLPRRTDTDAAGERGSGPMSRRIDFQTVTLAELVDSPVIMGKYMRSYRLGVENVAPHVMHMVADDPALLELPDWLKSKFEEMVRQEIAIFGRPKHQRFPRDRFHFLIMLGEKLRFGVEHGTSTFIGMKPRSLVDAKESSDKGGGAGLSALPHEYFHAWCAKLAAPRALITSDYHSAPGRDLLWVYEGLTTYYTGVVSVRSGLTTFDEHRDSLRNSVVAYQQRAGRLWRPVVDTARSVQNLRARSRSWSSRREGLEYYGQGAMFWLEADALIRTGTRGRRSLDDFTRRLFDVPVLPVGAQATYTRQDIVRTLADVQDGVDWDQLIHDRLERPQPTLDMSPLLEKVGYRLIFSDEPTDRQRKALSAAKTADVRTSIGLVVDKDNAITDIVPGSFADQAELAYGMTIIAVDSMAYTRERLRRAIESTPVTGHIDLIVRFGEIVKTIRVDYAGGGRYPRLERIAGRADLLKAIAKPLKFAPAR